MVNYGKHSREAESSKCNSSCGDSLIYHNIVLDRWSKPESLIALTPVFVLVAVCLLQVHSPVLLNMLVILLLPPANSNRLFCNKQEILAIEKWSSWQWSNSKDSVVIKQLMTYLFVKVLFIAGQWTEISHKMLSSLSSCLILTTPLPLFCYLCSHQYPSVIPLPSCIDLISKHSFCLSRDQTGAVWVGINFAQVLALAAAYCSTDLICRENRSLFRSWWMPWVPGMSLCWVWQGRPVPAVNVGHEEAEAAKWDWTVSSGNPASCRVNQPGQSSQCCRNSWVKTCWLPVLGRTILVMIWSPF